MKNPEIDREEITDTDIDWTPAERKAVDALVERICSETWTRRHDHDSLRAGRDWDTIQKWLEDDKSWEGHHRARMANRYALEVEQHRALIAYPLEWGFIEGMTFRDLQCTDDQ